MKLRTILLLTINENLIIAGVLPIAAPGVAYTATLTGRGGIEPYLWFLDSGSFPTGITGSVDSNNDYVISGTSSDLGPHTFTILLLDSEGRSATRTFNLIVQPLPLTITGTAPNAETGTPYSYTFNVSGGIMPYYPFLIVGGGSGPLPDGLTITQDSNGDVVLSGTPTVASFGQTFTIGVNDSQSPAAFASITTTISVGAAPLVVTGAFANTTPGNTLSGSPLAISGGIAPYGISGSPYSGTRPTGVTFSIVGSTLVASGNVAAGSYSWTERITSSDGQHFDVVSSIVSAYATLSVSGAFTVTDVGDPLQGSPLTITGGLAPYSLSGSPYSGTRPAGVTISISGSTVVATGNTTTAATYTWTERVLSTDGQHYDVACIVVVAAQTTWDSAKKASDITLAAGDTEAISTSSGGTGGTVLSVSGKSSGKFYAEVRITQIQGTMQAFGFGLHAGTSGLATYIGGDSNGWCGFTVGTGGNTRVTFHNGASTNSTSVTLAVNQSQRIAVDIGAGKLWISYFGQTGWVGGGDPAAGTSPTYTFTPSGTYYLGGCPRAGFGSSDTNRLKLLDPADWSIAAPSGFGVWTA